MVEGELEIIRPAGRPHHFVAVAVVAQGIPSIEQLKIIGDSLQTGFKPDLIPVKVPVLPESDHGHADKLQVRGHGRPVGIVEVTALRLSPARPQPKNVVGVIHGEGIFTLLPMKDR